MSFLAPIGAELIEAADYPSAGENPKFQTNMKFYNAGGSSYENVSIKHSSSVRVTIPKPVTNFKYTTIQLVDGRVIASCNFVPLKGEKANEITLSLVRRKDRSFGMISMTRISLAPASSSLDDHMLIPLKASKENSSDDVSDETCFSSCLNGLHSSMVNCLSITTNAVSKVFSRVCPSCTSHSSDDDEEMLKFV